MYGRVTVHLGKQHLELDEDAVLTANLEVLPRATCQVKTIHVGPEVTLCPTLDAHLPDADSLLVVVEHKHGTGRRALTGDDGVESHRVGGEGQQGRRGGCPRVVVIARDKAH